MLKDIIQICNASLEEVTGHPIGLVSTGKGMFPEEIKSKSFRWVRWIRDVLKRGEVIAGECKAYLCAFIEDELHLSWMQMFPSPFMPFIFILFFQESSQGTLRWLRD